MYLLLRNSTLCCCYFQDGGTALLLAAMKGHTDIVRDILSLKGVLVNLEDKVFVFVVMCSVFYFCSHL